MSERSDMQARRHALQLVEAFAAGADKENAPAAPAEGLQNEAESMFHADLVCAPGNRSTIQTKSAGQPKPSTLNKSCLPRK